MGLEHALWAVAAILGPMIGVPLYSYGQTAMGGQGITVLQGSCGAIFLAVLGVWLVNKGSPGESKTKAL